MGRVRPSENDTGEVNPPYIVPSLSISTPNITYIGEQNIYFDKSVVEIAMKFDFKLPKVDCISLLNVLESVFS